MTLNSFVTGGLSLEELNKLELELLGFLDFSLWVEAPLFERYSAAIDRVICISSAPSSPAPPPSSSSFSSSFSPLSSPSPCHLHHVHRNHGSTAFCNNTTTTTAAIPPSSTLSIAIHRTPHAASAMVAPKAQHSTSHPELIMDTTNASSYLSLHSARYEPQVIRNSTNGAPQSSENQQRQAAGLHSLWSFDNDSNWDLRGSDVPFSFDRPEDQHFTSSRSCSQLSMSAYSSHSSLSSASPGPLQRTGCAQPSGLIHDPHVHPARTAGYQMHAHASKQPNRSGSGDCRQLAHSNYYQHHGLIGSAGNSNQHGGGSHFYQHRPQPDLVRRDFQKQSLSQTHSSDAVDCRVRCRGASAERFVEPTASPNNIDHHHGSFHGSSPSLGFDFPRECGGPPKQFLGLPAHRHSARAVQCPGTYRLSDSDDCFEFSLVYGPPEEPSFFLAVPPRPPAASMEKQRQQPQMPELVPRDVYIQQQRSRGPPQQAYWTGTNQYMQSSQSAHPNSQDYVFPHSLYQQHSGVAAVGDVGLMHGGGVAHVSMWQRDSGSQQQPHNWALNLSRQQQQSHYHSMLGLGLLAGPHY